MPLTMAPVNPLPFFWSFYGHSYWNGSFGVHGPAGRADSVMRSLFGLEQVSATKNHAIVGAKATWTGLSQGGWVRLAQNEMGIPIAPSAPDISYDGAFFLGWGINDLGGNGNTAQMNTCYQHALRTCISRCRVSRVWPSNNAAFTYGTPGTGFADQAFAWETCPGDHFASATVTTTATISWTIPADYKGGPIVFLFLAQPGVKGATFTFGGTAGVGAPTVSTSNITPAGFAGGRVPVVRRITNLTSANAGQTITIAATSIDAGGTADFGGAWIETPYPPPVLVANAPRLNALGYLAYQSTYVSSLTGTAVASTPGTVTLGSGTTYGLPTAGSMTIPSAGGTVTLSWTGGPGSASTTTLTGVTVSGGSGNYSSNTLTWAGPVDADVLAFNTVLTSLFAEFDGMVQLVDLDTSIAKDPLALGDGLHPSELGAARIADTFRVAAQRLATSSQYGEASQMNAPNQALVPLYVPRVSNGWYTTPGVTIGGTAYTPVAGDLFAIPMNVTSQKETWFQWSVETLAGGTVAPTVLMCIYDDRSYSGLPKHIYTNPTSQGPLTIAAAGVFNSSTTGGVNGNLIIGPDPGLYWLALLIVTVGTGVTFRTNKGPTPLMPNLTSGGGGASTSCGWKLTGKGSTLPTSWDFPFTPGLNTPVDNCPMIGVKVF